MVHKCLFSDDYKDMGASTRFCLLEKENDWKVCPFYNWQESYPNKCPQYISISEARDFYRSRHRCQGTIGR